MAQIQTIQAKVLVQSKVNWRAIPRFVRLMVVATVGRGAGGCRHRFWHIKINEKQ